MVTVRKCPSCGGTHVQMSNERRKHGCLWFILFGWYYLAFKFILGLMVFMLYDWWMAIIDYAVRKKGHIWQCKRIFSFHKQSWYCHDCGCNFVE